MRCARAILALGGALLTLGPPSAARAYEHYAGPGGEPLRWASFPVPYRLGPTERRCEERLRLLRRGFEAWMAPPDSPVALRYEGPIDEAFVSGDGESSAVVLEAVGWPPELGDARTTAGATLHLSAAGTSQLLEADLGLNAVEFNWADETPAADALDLWSVVTHEVGHLLGLEHACDGPGPIRCADAPASIREAALFPAASPGDTSRRRPAADDLAGLRALYGPGTGAPPHATVIVEGCALTLRVEPAPGEPEPEVLLSESETGEAIGPSGLDPLTTSPGRSWDVTLRGANGKERTHFAALTLPESCLPEEETGCATSNQGAPPTLALALVLALGLSLKTPGARA
ncbi:MAG: hypothetical protein P1V51_18570 [Deltaproteobacteria bacterium]|nr:hypothetical protein [Deltaproteobacteria bacterium]